MHYLRDLIKKAKELETMVCVDYDFDKHLFTLEINMVGFKGQYLCQRIKGHGSTLHDAAQDFFRKARGGKIYHYITEKSVDII